VFVLFRLILPLLFSVVACSDEQQPTVPAASTTEAEPIDHTTEEVDDSTWPDRVAARHILIPFTGASGVPFGTTASREEALELVESIHLALDNGADMADLARIHSSDSTAGRGGFLGSAERGIWTEDFERAVFSLEVGATSEPVESPYGFHIIRREPLEEVKLLHLVIQHADSTTQWQDTPDATRTLEQARELAALASDRVEGGEDFRTIAAELSDGPNGIRGADLGWFLRGEISANFDEAVFALEIGDATQPIETPWGLHLVQRIE
jgi:peptidyl-prolyl cis-trans isomerase SurA